MGNNPEVARFHLDPKTLDDLYNMHLEINRIVLDLKTRPFGKVPPWVLVLVIHIEGSCKPLRRLLPVYAQLNGDEILSAAQALEAYPEGMPTKAVVEEHVAILRRNRREAIAKLERLMKSAAGVRLKSKDSEE